MMKSRRKLSVHFTESNKFLTNVENDILLYFSYQNLINAVNLRQPNYAIPDILLFSYCSILIQLV